jgi:Uma2 family endonuclease
VILPLSAATWEGFRAWAKSDAFPQRGRIAFLGEEVFIDMSPERIDTHAGVKAELYRVLTQLVRETGAGFLFPDGVLVSNKAAQVSNEPDAVFVSHAAFAAGRAALAPAADGQGWTEIVGTPDLVIEVVSPSSVGKDYRQLRARYHAAGIPEYWLIDALGDDLVFELLRPAPDGYAETAARDGWLPSAVFAREFRLTRETTLLPGLWQYTLHVRPLGAA